MKAWLRRLARFVYRLLRPLVRPIAFRIRGFLLVDVQRELSEMRRDVHELHGHARHEARLWREEMHGLLQRIVLAQREAQDHGHSLREALETLHRDSGIDRSELSAEIIQELQAARSFLEADIFKLSARIVGEFGGDVSPRFATAGVKRPVQEAGASASPVVVDCDAGEVVVGTDVGCLFCKAGDRMSLSALAGAASARQGSLPLIRQSVRPGDLFIDIGPGIGLGALGAAEAMQGRGRVLAYEPRPEMARLLEKSATLNGLSGMIEIHHPMPFAPGDTGRGRSKDLAQQPDSWAAPLEAWLAAVIEQSGGAHPLAAIRIGALDAIPAVLAAIPSIVRRNADATVIGEFDAARVREAGGQWNALLAAFAAHGFDCREIDGRTGALERWDLLQVNDVEPIKMLFARAGSPLLSI